MAIDRTRPYNALPDLPPVADLETPTIFRQVIRARSALAELKGACRHLPNLPLLADLVVLLESQASSAIEGIRPTTDDLFRALGPDDPAADPATKEVLRYREAIGTGYRRLRERPLGTNLFIEICQTIRRVEVGLRVTCGVCIARSDGEVVYTPPQGEALIRQKLANLETFLHEPGGLDPLVKLAVTHYQFEAIHPFTDGNGRTGRVLNILYLVEQGLLDLPVLSLSSYLLAHRPEYYRLLRNVTEQQAWVPWVEYLLEAIEQTAAATLTLIGDLVEQMNDVQETVRQASPTAYSRDLLELIFQQPYCRIGQVVEQLQTSRPTATRTLRALVSAGVLAELPIGREILFVNTPLVRRLQHSPFASG